MTGYHATTQAFFSFSLDLRDVEFGGAFFCISIFFIFWSLVDLTVVQHGPGRGEQIVERREIV